MGIWEFWWTKGPFFRILGFGNKPHSKNRIPLKLTWPEGSGKMAIPVV